MALLLLMAGAGLSSQKKWSLKPSVETDHTVVSFGEILLNHYAADAFTSSVLEHPVFHIQKAGKIHYTRDTLSRRLQSLFPGKGDLPVRIPPNGIWVKRVFRIKPERLVQAFRAVMQKQLGAMGRICIKRFRVAGNTEIPASAYRIIPVAPAAFRKRMTLKFRIQGTGWERTLFARGEIFIKSQVLVVKRAVRKGEPLGPENTALVEEDITRLHRSFLLHADRLRGMVAKRTLQPGRIISPEDLTAPLLIHRGQVVMIRVQTPNIFITAPGRAKQNGKFGEIIRVENLQSKKIIYARVSTSRTVNVEF